MAPSVVGVYRVSSGASDVPEGFPAVTITLMDADSNNNQLQATVGMYYDDYYLLYYNHAYEYEYRKSGC